MHNQIAITLGEPAGIGVELVAQLALQNQIDNCIVIGDQSLIQDYIDSQGLNLSINKSKSDSITCHRVPVVNPVKTDVLDVENAPYVLELLDIAAKGCMKGDYSAMVTAWAM